MNSPLNSLGIAKAPADTRVVVAMSGGVDSSVTAALLHEEGYDVVGVTLQLYDHGAAINKAKACCAGQDIYDAKRVAESKGFPHYVLNYESNFRDSVIDDFADSYLRGETPIPCVKCNQTVKFRDLLKVAHDLGADCMATGHYIKRVINPDTGIAELHRAHDGGKDQSYFLFATTQDQLDFLRFPLGGWAKDVTRQHAERLGLITANKPDSQDICFVPNGDYAGVVKKIRPDAEKIGDIVHVDGRTVGTHNGIIHYTIGQRRGLGIGGGVTENNDPLFVVKLNPSENQVIVGPKAALARDVVFLNQTNWLIDTVIPSVVEGSPVVNSELNSGRSLHVGRDDSYKVSVKLRSVSHPSPATLYVNDDGTAEIHLDAPQYGIAPGQAAVCYDGERVLGGGWIIGTENKAMKMAA